MKNKRKGGPFSHERIVRSLVNQWQRKAQEDSLVLLSFDPERFYRTEGATALLYEMEDLLYYPAFFLQDNSKAKLLAWSFPERLLRWFVPMESILQELDNLTTLGEISFQNSEWVLLTIQLHLHAQWWEELQLWLENFVASQEAKEPCPPPPQSNKGYRANNNSDDNLLDSFIPQDRLYLREAAEALVALGEEEALQKTIIGILTGDKTTKYLGSLPERTTTTLPNKETFIRRFFPLFSLLDLHREYLSQQAFVVRPEHSLEQYTAYQIIMVLNVIEGYLDYRRKLDA